MKKVYIGCFGSGLGHAARMTDVAASLSESGAQVTFSSSGEVARYIQNLGFVCNTLPHVDVEYTAERGVSMKRTLMASFFILARTWKQFGLELANMIRFGPDVVLSDSVLSTVMAGLVLRLRTVVVTSQLRLEVYASNSSVPRKLLSEGTSLVLQKLWSRCDSVLIPDMPPPYTISERNLKDNRVSKAKFIGLMTFPDRGVPDEGARAFARARKTKVYWQVSGPSETRGALVKKAVGIARALSRHYSFCITSGDPTGSTRARPMPWGWFYEWTDAVGYLMESCDVLVARGGHATPAQAARMGKPTLLIPIPNQAEQSGNARKCEKLGFALVMNQEDVSTEAVGGALEQLLSGPYRANGRRVSEVANSSDAKSEILRALG
jgi:UDP-N-acetylglucosamine--N-acetylmuramyl-(pentapeptide) pyrophosphoryl-undecaprenol N-acetylglucosamine transferase